MAEYEERTKTVIRHEISLALPSNWVELSKVLNVAIQKAKATCGVAVSDDTVQVSCGDEEIVLWWETST